MNYPVWTKAIDKANIYKHISKVASLLSCSGINLYWADRLSSRLVEKQSDPNIFQQLDALIEEDSAYIPCRAAFYKKIVLIRRLSEYLLQNPRTIITFEAFSIICIPIMNLKEQTVLVVEIYKNTEKIFLQADIDYILEFFKWFSMSLQQQLLCTKEMEMANRHDFLLTNVFEYFSAKISFEDMLSYQMDYAKKSIEAVQLFYFEFDAETEFADFYLEKINSKQTEVKWIQMVKAEKRVRFNNDKSYSSQLIRTRKLLNVQLLRPVSTGGGHINQIQSNSENLIDVVILQSCTENEIRSILLVPVEFADRILGFLVFVNKMESDSDSVEEGSQKFRKFNTKDEEVMLQMAKILALTVIFKKQSIENKAVSNYGEILRETVGVILKSKVENLLPIDENCILPTDFHEPDWIPQPEEKLNFSSYLYLMFQKISKNSVNHAFRDRCTLKKFIFQVQSLHRNNAYHNFETTFYIAHTVYCILIQIRDDHFKPEDRIAVLAASVLYYCNHNGLNNHYMKKTNHPLVRFYKIIPNQNHRVWIVRLLFSNLGIDGDDSRLDDRSTLCTVEKLLARSRKFEFSEFREKISPGDTKCRLNILCLILRCGVLMRYLRGFSCVRELCKKYYDEKVALGHLTQEKIPQEDESLGQRLPKFEVEYMENSVKPCLDILVRMFPETVKLMDIFLSNLRGFQLLTEDNSNKKIWDPAIACP